MKTTSQGWGIYLPLGTKQKEEIETLRTYKNIDASEQGTKSTTLLVDRHGNAILVREPRKIGFGR